MRLMELADDEGYTVHTGFVEEAVLLMGRRNEFVEVFEEEE